MESGLLEAFKPGLSFGTSLTPTTRLTKVRTDHSHTRTTTQQIQCRHLSKQSSEGSRKGLQKDQKKDLSRILRTDAAIRNIERKANSKKYNNLWPKPVLEALDQAIRNNYWETALKVCLFSLISINFLVAN